MLFLLGFCLIFFVSPSSAACPTSATGAWAEWSLWSGNCTTCPTACNQARLRLCIPNPITAGCIVEGLSCGGDAVESLACNNPSCATTTTESFETTTPPVCGEWAAWSCSCCGGCSTKRCTRVCQATDAEGCTKVSCDGAGTKSSPDACTSPSVSCKMPFPVCCEGQQAYVNTETKNRWCKLGA